MAVILVTLLKTIIALVRCPVNAQINSGTEREQVKLPMPLQNEVYSAFTVSVNKRKN